MSAPAGWYPTPDGNRRYWDGAQWTPHIAPPVMGQPPALAVDHPNRPARTGVVSWFGWGGLCLVALLGAATSGVSGFFVLSGTYVLVVALIALVRGRVAWAHLRTRAAGAAALGAAVVLTVVGGATASPPAPVAAQPTPAPTTASTSPTPTATQTPTPTPSATKVALTPATAAEGTALAAVAELTVKGRAPKTGYDRDEFGQEWFDTDGNGCDTRNDMLRRDLVDKDMKNDCRVLAGTRNPDPYTGKKIPFVVGGASEIDIDHMVALSDTWQKGAASWSAGKRLAFANDPLNLMAVSAGANRAKGDGDVATWLPPNKTYRCQYVARIVSVKVKYEVWVTGAERDAMVRVLSNNCATVPLPQQGPAPTTAAVPESTPKPAPPPAPAPAPPPAPAPAPPPAPAPEPEPPTSVYYENCDAVRAAGAAPLLAGQPGYAPKLDRDGDGIACE